MSGAGHRALVFVGGGPRTVGLLERLAANSAELLGPDELTIHVVDPYPVGGGRIWRQQQSALLWMNSMARDVTIFTDSSVSCEGPIVPGPALDEWVAADGRAVLEAAGVTTAAAALRPEDFASRQIQSHYLRWAHERAVASLPTTVEVVTHTRTAVDVADVDGRQQVTLNDGTILVADVVVLAQGFLDQERTAEQQVLAAAAQSQGLTYIPPGYTADIDLSALRPGEPVLVRGFGLAFIDLMVLLGEGRGGHFSDNHDGTLTYHPSGAEPVLHVGSRRGIPYHAKLGYSLAGSAPVPPRYFTVAAVNDLARSGGPVDFRRDIWPLIAKELTAAHYRRLFHAHPERTIGRWSELESVLATSSVTGPAFALAVEQSVPKREDRFDLTAIDKPLSGKYFGSGRDLTAAVLDHIRSDLRRRADSYYSPDAAVFDALLSVYGVLAVALTSGVIGPVDRIRFVEGEFHGFFSFLASGPPPRRLAELLALHDAGLIEFRGPDFQVAIDNGHFVGTSPAIPGAGVTARALVDAFLPRPDVRASTDPVIRGLLAAGELAAEELRTDDGQSLPGGQLLADSRCNAIRSDRTVHPRRFLLGPSVSGSAGSAGFSRPGFNGPGFRQNDAVARSILRLLDRSDTEPPATTVPPTAEPTAQPSPHPTTSRVRSKELHHAR